MTLINRNLMQRVGRAILAISLVITLSAFRHTEVRTNTYADYAGYTFDTVYVRLPDTSADFKEVVTERLAKQFRKLKIKMYTDEDLFSPFETWSSEAKAETLARHGVDATIEISLETANSRSGSGIIFFDADLGMASEVRSRSDSSVFHVRLIDEDSKDLVWMGILQTRGNGTLFVGAKSTAKAVSKHLVKSMKESGHLPR